ncbi:MAG: hypothetical protein MZV65_33690 [Chromatiales bacterium]|nr:hypothetical protein [Chromatiales bacterium]
MPLSGVEPELLHQAFPAGQRRHRWPRPPNWTSRPRAIRVRCETCGEETEAAPNRLLCGVVRRLAYAGRRRGRDDVDERGT